MGEGVASAEKGVGLGLSITKNIVESMGGKIHLASRLGKGTSFWFDLPLVKAATQEEPPAMRGPVGVIETDRLRNETLANAIGTLKSTDHRGLRLLVADDNEINRLLLRAQLQGFAVEIADACDGKEALERMCHQGFDLIFLDLQMPLMDGPQVLRELRGNPGSNRHTPVIAITAFSAPGHREAIIHEGFADCLIKPILQEQLTRLLDAWLDAGDSHTEQAIEPPPAAETYAYAILEKTGGNRELAAVIAHKLFAELPETLRHADIAVGNRQQAAAQQAVHKINGSAAFCGLEDIRQAAASLESALSQGEDGEILEILRQDLAREIDGFLSLESAILDWLDHRDRQVGE